LWSVFLRFLRPNIDQRAPLRINFPQKHTLKKESCGKQEVAPTVPSAVFRGFIEFKDFQCQKIQSVKMCHIYFNSQMAFLCFLELFCVIVSHCDTCHGCHTCVMCHICHKYQCHVSLVNKFVIGDHLETDFNKVWGSKSYFMAFGRLLCSQPKAKIGLALRPTHSLYSFHHSQLL
jgi:hypothetical protein